MLWVVHGAERNPSQFLPIYLSPEIRLDLSLFCKIRKVFVARGDGPSREVLHIS